MDRPVDEHDVEQTLDGVESLWRVQQEAACATLVFAAHYADLCDGDGLPGVGSRALPGTERRVRLGGVGTPRVAEFAAAELAARMRMSPRGGRALLADALDARHRLPLMWVRVQSGEARAGWVRYVAAQTRHLSAEAAGRVDADLVEVVDGRLPWSRFESRLEGRIVAADPEVAAQREEEERARVFARASRSSEAGMKSLYVRAPAAVVIRVEATIAYVAQALAAMGDTDSEDERRVKAVLLLANPTQAVELLAAYAAHRARTGADTGTDADVGTDAGADVPLPGCDPGAGAADVPAGPREPGTDDAGEAAGSTAGDAAGGDAQRAEPVGANDAVGAAARDAAARDAAADADLADRDADAADADADDAVDPRVPRRFRPGELPRWLARASDPEHRWRWDWPALLPRANIWLHLAGETLEGGATGPPGGVVRWEGEGPVSLAYLREQLAPYHAMTVRPVLDLAGQEPVDSYEIPARHRRAVALRTPADCFPFAAQVGGGLDLDHTEPFDHSAGAGGVRPGQSRMDNYGPLGRLHHRIKTHGGWQVRQPFEGIYLWRDPHGHHYLVDHTGTRKLDRPREAARPRPRTIELYIRPDLDLRYDAA